MARLLLGESKEDAASAIRQLLFSNDEYTVHIEANGLRIIECLRKNQYDVIALEVELPGFDVISVIRDYRARGFGTPILIMADRHCSDQLQGALDAGADAYFVKPFQIGDLAAQLRALLRRPTLRSDKMLTRGGIAMDTTSGTLTRNDIAIHLHPMEFKLLQFLMTHPNEVFSSHALFERVWQKDFGLLEDTVRTHVRTLRQKVDTKGHASIITTVRGLGYKTESR